MIVKIRIIYPDASRAIEEELVDTYRARAIDVLPDMGAHAEHRNHCRFECGSEIRLWEAGQRARIEEDVAAEDAREEINFSRC